MLAADREPAGIVHPVERHPAGAVSSRCHGKRIVRGRRRFLEIDNGVGSVAVGFRVSERVVCYPCRWDEEMRNRLGFRRYRLSAMCQPRAPRLPKTIELLVGATDLNQRPLRPQGTPSNDSSRCRETSLRAPLEVR